MRIDKKHNKGFTHTHSRRCGGFTLIELLVASGLFLVLVGLATGTFIQTLKTQRIITSLSESMNNVAFVMEQMSREIRVGFGFSGGAEVLNLTNSNGEQITYRQIGNGIGRCVQEGVEPCADSEYEILTAPNVEIEGLNFILSGESPGDKKASRVTILLSVTGEKQIEVNLETTVSTRQVGTES
jgi:prepilin-type N-terminal cleavage/methylation domain-containing protein